MVRKIGARLRRQPYTGTLVALGAGKLGLPIPAPLLSLLGLHKGQRLRAKVVAGKVTLTVRRAGSSAASAMSRKRSGAERVRFEARWNRLARSLNKARRGRGL